MTHPALALLARTTSQADREIIADMIALTLLTTASTVTIEPVRKHRKHWTQTAKGKAVLAERSAKAKAKAK